ncbi:MAG: hypothetical protein WC208_10490 [Gallionella sp.]|jgi:hypothetical protein
MKRIAWNKGLTKETDNRVLLNSVNSAKAAKAAYRSGRRKPIKLFGNKNPSYKGGQIVDSQGYVYILTTPNRKYTKRCRLVIEKVIGRKLTSKEQVHHRNRIRSDDRVRNLMVFISNSAHRRFERGGVVKPEEIIFDGKMWVA